MSLKNCQVMRIRGANGRVKELYFPKSLDLDRPKRPRTTFNAYQLTVLEAEFAKSPYLIGTRRKRLAKELSLSETQIKVWYQNRRTKQKAGVNGGGGHDDKPSTEGLDADASSASSDSSSTSSSNFLRDQHRRREGEEDASASIVGPWMTSGTPILSADEHILKHFLFPTETESHAAVPLPPKFPLHFPLMPNNPFFTF